MSSQSLNQSVIGQPEAGMAKYSKVLLIDDNSLDNFVNKKLLEANGFATEVTAFQSAEEALTFLKSASALALPDVIFLDIMMPGMDGFQFLDEFATLPESTQQQCKIIMLSTSESFRDLNRANKNRFIKKFLNKPLTNQTVNAIHV
jgi:CheY-like chemotaxis protein